MVIVDNHPFWLNTFTFTDWNSKQDTSMIITLSEQCEPTINPRCHYEPTKSINKHTYHMINLSNTICKRKTLKSNNEQE